MFLNNLQSSKSAPGIMAAGNYAHSSTQHEETPPQYGGGTPPEYGGGQPSFRSARAFAPVPAPAPAPAHSQTIGGADKQCGNLTANIFIQTPKKVTCAMTTTDSFNDLNKTAIDCDSEDDIYNGKNKPKRKQQEVQSACPSTSDCSSKFFENLVKAIWTTPAADDCQSHCLKCCNKEQHVSSYSVQSQANLSCSTPKTTFCGRSQMVVMWDDDSASRPSFDDCKTYCMKCCDVTPPASSSKTRHTLSPIPNVSSSEAEHCQTHCEECCKGRRAELSPPRHYAPEQAPAMNFETYCSNERLEQPPCPPQPPRVSCKPSMPSTFPPESFKAHCSKCCELASGNRAPSGGHFKCVPSSTHSPPKDNSASSSGHFKCAPSSTHCPPKDNSRPSLLTMEELERIKMKFLETKIKLNNLIKCTTPRNARSANPITCSGGGQSYTNSCASPVSSHTSGPCQTCDIVKQQSHHHYP